MVRELLGLFQAFEREEAQRSTPEAVRPATIAPNALREALHDLNPCLFSVGTTSPSSSISLVVGPPCSGCESQEPSHLKPRMEGLKHDPCLEQT